MTMRSSRPSTSSLRLHSFLYSAGRPVAHWYREARIVYEELSCDETSDRHHAVADEGHRSAMALQPLRHLDNLRTGRGRWPPAAFRSSSRRIADTKRVLSIVDGLLLQRRRRYRSRPSTATPTSIPRHTASTTLATRSSSTFVRSANERDIPILCICRGIQVLNVALGGTLIQDVPDQLTEIEHRQHQQQIPPTNRQPRRHARARIVLAAILWHGSIQTNSFHHQAIKDVAPGLEVTADPPMACRSGRAYRQDASCSASSGTPR